MVKTYPVTTTIRYKLLLLALLLLFAQTVIAAVDARVDRSSLRLGETVTLVLETKDTAQSLEINTAQLEADFIVIDTRSESLVSYVNGKQTATVRIVYVLEPKKTGELMIPAFRLGAVTTKAISLTVNPAPAEIDGEPPLVFIEVELNKGKAYVHSQLALTVRLFFRYNLAEANLADPKIDHAAVIKLGETSMNASRYGVNYRALERVYAVFPERSGELRIPELDFWGRVNEPSTRRSGSLFSPLNRGRRVRAASEALSVLVEPKPAGYPATASWLPARSLSVNSEIKFANAGVRVGEPVTRTIKLQATGLSDTMLPEINWPPLDGARVYPENPDTVARADGHWVKSRKTSSFAIVPELEGELLLPEISIPWWDVKEDKLKYAIVPAEKVLVLPARGGVVGTTVAPPIATEVSQPVSSKGPASSQENQTWRTLAIIGFSLWILTVILLLIMRRNKQPDLKPEQRGPKHSDAFAEFELACKQGQAGLAASTLRRFSQNELGIVDGLGGLAKRCTEDGFTTLADSINSINQELYSSQAENQAQWNGRDFRQQLKDWLKQHRENSSPGRAKKSLPPFYPE